MRRLTPHLDRLEAAGIHIIRAVAASFRAPLLPCSVGKGGSAMRHLAMKAGAPSRPVVRRSRAPITVDDGRSSRSTFPRCAWCTFAPQSAGC
jgi:3'-phosphoadenosine 5'-phosphosulfate sulfotransferase (PAPS reductase)/FAD synthetase